VLGTPGLAQAAPASGRLVLDRGDEKFIRITAFVDRPNDFVAQIRLRALGGPVGSFEVVASDLRRRGDIRISRDRVTVTGPRRLARGATRNFQIKVSGVEMPGKYRGTLRLRTPRGKALWLALRVNAKERPQLAPAARSERLDMHITKCTNRVTCWFLPEKEKQATRALWLDNPGHMPVRRTQTVILASGESSGRILTEEQLQPEDKYVFWGRRIERLDLHLDPDTLAPDHYVGLIHMTIRDRDERLTVPVDVSVRAGPFWAIVALFAGILLGRLALRMRGGATQEPDFARRIQIVEERLRERPDDRVYLDDQMEAARRAIADHDLEKAERRVAAVEGGDRILTEVKGYEDSAPGSDPAADELITDIRRNVDRNEYDAAQTKLEELRTHVSQTPGTSAEARQHAATAQVAAERVVVARSKPKPSSSKRFFRRLLLGAAGHAGTPRGGVLWIGRALLGIALLVFLVFVGLETLYVKEGATFGAGGASDYVALMLWGLSADVASRTLTTLRGPSAPGG
jgi:hypothetical protein